MWRVKMSQPGGLYQAQQMAQPYYRFRMAQTYYRFRKEHALPEKLLKRPITGEDLSRESHACDVANYTQANAAPGVYLYASKKS